MRIKRTRSRRSRWDQLTLEGQFATMQAGFVLLCCVLIAWAVLR